MQCVHCSQKMYKVFTHHRAHGEDIHHTCVRCNAVLLHSALRSGSLLSTLALVCLQTGAVPEVPLLAGASRSLSFPSDPLDNGAAKVGIPVVNCDEVHC